MSLLTASRARYTQCAVDARRQAVHNLRNAIEVPFGLAEWSNRAAEAYAKQWPSADRHPKFAWDWLEIHRAGKTDPTKFDVVVWGPNDRLSCLGQHPCPEQPSISIFLRAILEQTARFGEFEH